MSRWLTIREFCAIYGFSYDTVMKNFIPRKRLAAIKIRRQWRVLDPGWDVVEWWTGLKGSLPPEIIPMLTAAEVGRILGTSSWAVRRAADGGYLKCSRVNGVRMFSINNIRRWICHRYPKPQWDIPHYRGAAKTKMTMAMVAWAKQFIPEPPPAWRSRGRPWALKN